MNELTKAIQSLKDIKKQCDVRLQLATTGFFLHMPSVELSNSCDDAIKILEQYPNNNQPPSMIQSYLSTPSGQMVPPFTIREVVRELDQRIQALETRIHNDEKFILELRSELIDLIDASREPSTPPSNPNNNQPPTKSDIE